MLGKRSYHHHSRTEPERRSGARQHVYSVLSGSGSGVELLLNGPPPLMTCCVCCREPGTGSRTPAGTRLLLLPACFLFTPQHILSSLQYNGRSSSSGNTRGGVMIRKRRPNWIDAPDDSFFLVTRETR